MCGDTLGETLGIYVSLVVYVKLVDAGTTRFGLLVCKDKRRITKVT